ncbi:hypothetical protein [Dasania marina]|uniref:hypothetical protein n=1 Tax=Dasania marina TaxID=471499 RepID=UPI0030D958B2
MKSNITDNESCKVKTNKGVIQGYNGVAAVDKKHQIIIDAQAFGEGQEYHTLKPVLESIKDRYERLDISDDIYKDDVIVTADTGFSNEDNNQYLIDEAINGYIPDNQFRSRDPRYKGQKDKYGKRHQDTKIGIKEVIPGSEFTFNLKKKSCVCPTGNAMWLRDEKKMSEGKLKLSFEGTNKTPTLRIPHFKNPYKALQSQAPTANQRIKLRQAVANHTKLTVIQGFYEC